MHSPDIADWRGLRCPALLITLKLSLQTGAPVAARVDDGASVSDLCRYLRRYRHAYACWQEAEGWMLEWDPTETIEPC